MKENGNVQKCKAIKRNESPCESYPMKGGEYCYIHSIGRSDGLALHKKPVTHFFVGILSIIVTITLTGLAIISGPTREGQETTHKSIYQVQEKLSLIEQKISQAQNDPEEKIESELDKEFKKVKEKSLTLYNSGNALFEQGRFEEALSYFSKAQKIVDIPSFPFAKGNALYFLGRIEKALAAYEKALDVKPEYAEALNNKGNALSALGKNKEAIAAYDKALEIKPDYAGAWYNKGIALYALNQKEEAIEAYDKALEIRPDDYAGVWEIKGDALYFLGRYKEAIEAYDNILKTNTDDYAGVLKNKGDALYFLGRHKEAIENYDKILEVIPDSIFELEIWTNKGNALSSLGNYDEGLEMYDKVLQMNPDFPRAVYSRGSTLRLLGRKEEALAAYEKALSLFEEIKSPHADLVRRKITQLKAEME